ncbi:MAG: hypothetical protein GXO32_03325 [Crenarchaeota archaeon]|nr:hypothetical protein [Thermoproteota archaeon]
MANIKLPEYLDPKALEWLRERNLLPDGAEKPVDPVTMLAMLAEAIRYGKEEGYGYEIETFGDDSYWTVIHVWKASQFDAVAIIGAQDEFAAWAWS